MKLVEVVKADQTSDATVEALIQFVKNINKVPVKCKDTPGKLFCFRSSSNLRLISIPVLIQQQASL